MSSKTTQDDPRNESPKKELTPAARRALAEAEERRAAREAGEAASGKPAAEINGPKGAEPTRYGDWERNGIVSDF